jgi:Apea-like HEPN
LERIKREAFGKQIEQGILKIPLEGFISIEEKLVLADNLEIEKVTSEVRDQFFQRAAGLELGDYRHENNWFFLTYKFEDERRKIGGIDTGNRILLVAIFFAVCTEKLIRINKSQGFAFVHGELSSIGISRIPNVPWSYDHSAKFETEDIDKLREFWPLFRATYNDQTHFALVARRFYFSLIRNQWEDQFIDLIIALEALLVPEMDEVNKSGKIAKRLSRLLTKHYLRGEVSKVALTSYDIRNKIVHGKLDGIDINEAHTLKDQIRVYVKQAIQVYLLHYRNLTTQELADQLEQISGDQI